MWDITLSLGSDGGGTGNYTCEFATFPKGTSQGVTWLRVLGEQGRGAGAARSEEEGCSSASTPRACFWALAREIDLPCLRSSISRP